MVFLYFFSICSLLVDRKATDFCKLILYPATFIAEAVYGVQEFLGGIFWIFEVWDDVVCKKEIL
jgi:hypothetical protein